MAAGYDPQGYVPVGAGQVRIGLQRRTALSAEHHFRPAHFTGPRVPSMRQAPSRAQRHACRP
jgi:hypothetical protein